MDHRRARSFFWPILLIGVGLLWLLSNLGFIEGVSFATIFRFWPLILIVIGLDLIIGRSSGVISAVLALFALAVMATLIIAAPSLGFRNSPDAVFETFQSEKAGAKYSEVTLDLSSYPTTVQSIKDADLLFLADVGYYGEMRFSESGESTRRITLEHYSSPDRWFEINFDPIPIRWEVGLNPDVPTDLYVDGGSGSVDMDLSDLALTAFTYDGGSGSLDLSLPTSKEGYTGKLETGSGAVRVRISGNESLTLELDGGSGSTTITLPANTAVRVEVMDDGSGSLRLPSGLEQTRFGDDDEGTWQSPDFDQADVQILIRIVDAGSGSITIR